jgi:hypothetical protein
VRHRCWATLAAFAVIRVLGLAFETALATLRRDRESLDLAIYQLRAHVRLSPRYLTAPLR